jgi:hypothetical protein
MVQLELLFKFKSIYGHVYSATIKGAEVFFRELTFKEYDQIIYNRELEGASSADLEDLIIEKAIIYPEDFDLNKIPPGAVTSLAKEVLDMSGFSSVKQAKNVLEEKRSEAQEVKNLMKAFVLAAMDGYTLEDLENMTFSKLAEKVAIAEKIIDIKQAINGIESTDIRIQLIDPEEEEIKQKVSASRHNSSKPQGAANYEDPIAQKLWGVR